MWYLEHYGVVHVVTARNKTTVCRAKKYGLTFKIYIFYKVVIVTAHPMGVKVSTVLVGCV